jgi:hypothetical protein
MNSAQIGERFLRQKDIADPTKFLHPVTIFGTGAIGSVVAIGAAKMGCSKGLTLIDRDVFEEHNVPNQMCYERLHLGISKVSAIGDLCRSMGHIGHIRGIQGELKGNQINLATKDEKGQALTRDPRQIFSGIVVNTPDSMTARKDLFKAVTLNPAAPHLIDARLAGPYLMVVYVNTMSMDDIRRYQKTLYSDSEATLDDCGARAVIDYSFHAGAWVLTLIRKIQTKAQLFREVRFDIATGELTLTLSNGTEVSNKEALAYANAEL